MIRAVTHPYPGAFVGDGAARLYLWEAGVDDGPANAAPGTLTAVRAGEGISVAAGDGIVRLTRVQGAGGLEQRADLWAHAAGLVPGARVGGELT